MICIASGTHPSEVQITTMERVGNAEILLGVDRMAGRMMSLSGLAKTLLPLALLCPTVAATVRAEQWERIPVTRDTWLSGVGAEANGSNGGAPRLKLKSIQELSIIDLDIEKLNGREILEAQLFLKVASDEPIERVTASTITVDWVEGEATGYQVVDGVSTFSHRVHPTQRWNGPDVTSVCIGNGGSFYSSNDALPASEALPTPGVGWVQIAIPEKILRARCMGLSYGIVLMDDTGSTWTRDGETFKYKLFPNRYVYSRNSNSSSAPYLMVRLGSKKINATEGASIQVPTDLRWNTADNESPWRRLQWRMQLKDLDDLLGFRVEFNGEPLPATQIPAWSQHREGVFVLNLEAWLKDRNSASPAKVSIVALDRLGRATSPATIEIRPGTPQPIRLAPSRMQQAVRPVTQVTDWSSCLDSMGSKWTILDPLDSWLPTSQKIIPAQNAKYLAQNHLWNSAERRITLHAPRGAWCGFQLASQRPVDGIDCRVEWEDALGKLPGLRTECSRYGLVPGPSEAIPDPLIPMSQGTNIAKWTLGQNGELPGKSQSWLVESYVPKQAPAGTYRGKLIMERSSERTEIEILLRVYDVVLPDRLSFLPEMNCYDLPENDIDYYRLGNRHRVVLNRLPYFQNGRLAVDRCPTWRNGQMDWQAYDAHYSNLFNGRAFADLPRGEVPIECFYLPMHENWPSPMEGNYNGGYWADRSFPQSYRQAFASAVEQCADHFQSKGWHETRFHVYLNNKVDFKQRGWSRGSSPWLLDEPANFQDYWALNYFALASKEGRLRSEQKRPGYAAKVLFRADISRPQWQRDTLDGLSEYYVISFSSFHEYRPLVLERKFRDAQTVVVYGGNNPIGTSNCMAVIWSWDAWCQGADGIVPWQTIGNANSWTKVDELSLFYPHPTDPKRDPIPSIRLKAYCYGQQDVELLTQLAAKSGVNRYAFGDWLRPQWNLNVTLRADGQYNEPAAWNDYSDIDTPRIHQMRVAWLETLAKP